MLNEPQNISGNGMAAWLNRLKAWCKTFRLLDSPDLIIERTADGTRVRIKQQGGSSGDGPYWV